MNKYVSLLFLSMMQAPLAHAHDINEDQALEIAVGFMQQQAPAAATPKDGATGVMEIQETICSERDGRPLLYVFRRDGGGFVIVSADSRTPQNVLAYSTSGCFGTDGENLNARNFIRSYMRQMEEMDGNAAQKVKAPMADATLPATVSPLLTSKWNQYSPFNDYCPTVDGVRCPTGCVATAMAQVMYLHQWPQQGRGEHSYIWTKGNTTLSADFSKSVYEWDKMLPVYNNTADEEARHQVAQLMSDVGIAFDMNYEPAGSGTAVDREAMVEFFDYDASLNHLERQYCSNDEWENLIRKELSEGRPVLYGGGSGYGAHEFVCDGYDAKGYFHFNMGWGGQSDGYYLTTATGFDLYQGIHFNIKKNEGGRESLVAFQTNDFRYDAQLEALTLEMDVNYSQLSAIEIAVAVEDAQGNVHYDACHDFSQTCSFTLSGGLDDGEYRIFPVARLKGTEEWQKIFHPDLRQGEVNLSVSNGVYGYSNDNLYDEVREGAVEINGICYTLNKTSKKATVTYRNKNYDFYVGKKNIVIPDEVEYNNVAYSVTAIGEEAFNGSDAETITLPASVTEIQMGGLGAMQLHRVAIPADSKLKKVDGWGFNGCIRMNAIRLPETLQQIGMCGFQSARLAALVLPKKCTSLGKMAFNCNTLLRNVYVEYTTKPKADALFQYCDNLETLYVPVGKGDLYRQDTQWSGGFKEVKEYSTLEVGGVKYACCPSDNTAVLYMATTDANGYIYVPTTVDQEGGTYKVERIEAGAFEGVTEMTSFAMGSGITSIGEAAFMGCKGLNEVVIGTDVTSIGTDAFFDCPALESVYCTGQRPAKIEEETFPLATYAHATLYVPEGCSGTYKAMKGWQLFENIVEFNATAVEHTASDAASSPVDVYNLQGICLRHGVAPQKATEGLPKGTYLISDGKRTENTWVE